jgi:hypothetical protein
MELSMAPSSRRTLSFFKSSIEVIPGTVDVTLVLEGIVDISATGMILQCERKRYQ